MTEPLGEYRVLPLTKGFVAIVSKEDWRRVKKHKWYTHMSAGSRKKCGQPYARANIKGKKIYLHRFVMGAENPELHVDHRNHQTLDCRRENLEVTDHITNQQRRRKKNAAQKKTNQSRKAIDTGAVRPVQSERPNQLQGIKPATSLDGARQREAGSAAYRTAA